VAEGLVQHAEDIQDTNLSLMIWYGIEPIVPQDPKHTLALLAKTKIPLVREYVVRRLGDPARLIPVLAQETDVSVQRDLLRGLLAAFEGWGPVPAPAGWSRVYAKLSRSPDAEVRGRALTLAV